MLDIKSIRHNPQRYKEMLKTRGYKVESIDQLLSYDQDRRSMIEVNEKLKQHRNEVSKKIAKKKSSGDNTEHLIGDMKGVSTSIKENNEQLKIIEANIHEVIMSLPNTPHDCVSKDVATEKCIVNTWTPKKPASSLKEYKTHWEIGQKLNIFDYDRADKVTNTNFIYFRKQGARLIRALTNYIFDSYAEKEELEEVIPPYFINESVNIPIDLSTSDSKNLGIKRKDLSLVTKPSKLLLSLFSDLILEEKDIPRQLITSVPIFQSSEFSSYKREKDISLLPQSNNIELLILTKPGSSFIQFEKWTECTRVILQKLNLPHRTINLPTNRLSFSASKTYAIEVWMSSQKRYKKLSSINYSSDFLTRRYNIRYRSQSGQVSFLHSINGIGFKVETLLAALLENYQQEDGSIQIPEVLSPYMGGTSYIYYHN